MRDNYKIQTENARKIFLRYDQQKIIHTFELKHDEIFLFLNFLHRPYRICRKTGAAEYETPQKLWLTAGFHEVLSIYDMLCNPNGKPVLSGSWSPVGIWGVCTTLPKPWEKAVSAPTESILPEKEKN